MLNSVLASFVVIPIIGTLFSASAGGNYANLALRNDQERILARYLLSCSSGKQTLLQQKQDHDQLLTKDKIEKSDPDLHDQEESNEEDLSKKKFGRAKLGKKKRISDLTPAESSPL